MKYRRLGNSGLKVSEISLGSWLTYGGYVGKEQAISIIDKAYELGINFFDTANIYMHGEAEKIVGEALRKYPRESYVLATKVWGPMGERPNDRGLSRKHIMEQCEASLKRLGLDYIDVYYCHAFDYDTPMEETLRAMDDLVRQGKVLYIGISNWTAAQIAEAVSIVDKYLLHRIVVNQPLYNMFAREIEKEIIPLCERNGIGQVVYSPLAQGVLAGKYKAVNDAPAGSRATDKHGTETVKSWLKEENLRKVERLRPIAEELGLSLAQLALAWTLRQPNVSSAIIGASRPEQVEDNIKASGVVIPDEALAKIDEILQAS
ncbi:aldo/keto reductase family protein [Polycladomyces subterraneus]|jgi:voltage-dependent potassium channel beta subunit|uniref:Aldo/keto reductase family protein n=1 Tax=Polycladomyces subterraneus TaxID=1016997 RepID=A0ABT8ILY3_9BACL|nr:aldo/keto reductase family protein [Polycladomyces subterraneus]MDN4593795.1 aldo/keto reductase family protein [Polycladomyces subterraneus]